MLGDGPAFWIFFLDLRIRVNLEQSFDEILGQVFKVMLLLLFDWLSCQKAFTDWPTALSSEHQFENQSNCDCLKNI